MRLPSRTARAICLAVSWCGCSLFAATLHGQDAPAVDEAPESVPQAVPVDQPPTAAPVPAEPTDNGEAEETAAPKEITSVSPSGQMIVRGNDAGLCSALSTQADGIRKNLLDLLKVSSPWKYAINIRLYGAPGDPLPANPVRLGITLVGDIPAFAINIHTGQRIEVESLSNAITTMLLYEIALRNVDPGALPEEIKLPPWLLYGIQQAILWKSNHINRDTYAALFQREEIFHPEEILVQKNPKEDMDATTFAAYEASCGVLTLCLLSQKGGEEAMLRVLDESIFGSDDPVNLIKRNFPLLTLTPSSLHKWWTLQLSQMATPPMTESLSIPDSDKRLGEALTLMKYNPETRMSTPVSLDNIDTALAIGNLKEQLPGISNNLVYLSSLCFPTYRPIVVQYARIIADIQMDKGEPEEWKRRIGELVELRQLSLQAAVRARDYLDWFEITTKSKQSNTFDSYLNAVKSLREQEKEKNTPIANYLRDVERLYTQPASARTTIPVQPAHQ